MTSFSDDFNRADGAPGANWVDGTGLWTIVSNQLSSGSAGGTVVIRAATAMATDDNSAQITITATSALSHGVWCRGNTGFTQGYLWRNDGTSWNLFSNVGGSFTSIGSFAGAAVVNDIAKVQAVGSTIKGFVNGVERVSVTDTAVTTGTSVGLRAESSNALRFDDFSAADVSSGTTASAEAAIGAATALGGATDVAVPASTASASVSALLPAGGVAPGASQANAASSSGDGSSATTTGPSAATVTSAAGDPVPLPGTEAPAGAAAVSGSAGATSCDVAVPAGAAAALAAAVDVVFTQPQTPDREVVSGRAPASELTGRESGEGAGREPVPSVSGRKPSADYGGRES